jgi:hypothetical protein
MFFRSLTSENYVTNRLGGKNIVLNDREYNNHGPAKYVCNQSNLNGCTACLIVNGDIAILKKPHDDDCMTLSQKHAEWIANSTYVSWLVK